MARRGDRSVDVAAELNAPPERVWELLADTSRWAEWGPSVVSVEPAAARVEAGLRGRIWTRAGFSLPFEITGVEPGRAWRWRVAGVTATGHRVEALGPSRCRVVFEVPLWAAPYAVVCRLALRRIARLVA